MESVMRICLALAKILQIVFSQIYAKSAEVSQLPIIKHPFTLEFDLNCLDSVLNVVISILGIVKHG